MATWITSTATGVTYTGATAPIDIRAYDLTINGTSFGPNGNPRNVDISIDTSMTNQGANYIASG